MALFYSAKNNLVAKFKARFSSNTKWEDYLFYPKEYDQGYACSESDYLKFTKDFEKLLKQMTWAMWVWFLIGFPVIIGLAVWQDYEINSYEQFIIVILPLPFIFLKGWKVYNAPDVLTVGKRPVGRHRNQEQIMETRIKGMSWGMLIAMVVVPLFGSYIIMNDTSLADWEVSAALCLFITVLVFGVYLIMRKWKIQVREKNQI